MVKPFYSKEGSKLSFSNCIIYLISKVIIVYQYCISPYLPCVCYFNVGCSEYTRLVIQKYGLIKGIYLGCKRLMKCHPF